MASPILWQSEDRTVTLVDIPQSIAAAQATVDHPYEHVLLSCDPLSKPFPSCEPKSAKAKQRMKDNTTCAALDLEYRRLLSGALEDVTKHHTGDWCFPRRVNIIEELERPAKRAKLTAAGTHGTKSEPSDLPPDLLEATSNLNRDAFSCVLCSEDEHELLDSTNPPRGFLCHSTAPAELQLQHPDTTFTFRIPPGATAYLGDCNEPRALHHAVRHQAQQQDTRRTFDFILLDPPWPNRSVRRTHKSPGTSYSTFRNLDHLSDTLCRMDLDMLMADTCLVGIWITNKPAVRETVLGEHGLFATWGVALVEEWLWLKTTVAGEPVGPLDSAHRKPYEVFLLGRRRRTTTGSAPPPTPPALVVRKVVVAVPDLHSRKPCLKALIDPMVGFAQYRALEIFARHLVAGWWSWGNECVKFNWEGCWCAPHMD